jgi:hypothetical protein
MKQAESRAQQAKMTASGKLNFKAHLKDYNAYKSFANGMVSNGNRS